MADKSRYTGHLIDFNVRAERMGWLPSAPQLGTNPLTIAGEAEAGMNPVDYTVKSLKEGSIRFAAEQPENGKKPHPRNLFIWRSNLLGSSGKGYESRLSTCWDGARIQGKYSGQQGGVKPEEVDWQDNGCKAAGFGGYAGLPSVEHLSDPHHSADGDLVRKKRPDHTSDMHPFIHPLSAGG